MPLAAKRDERFSDAERRWSEDVPGQQGVDRVDGMLADTGENLAQVR
jgi:hypothetical protein